MITLQRFDDKFEDFYDSEKDSFIVYAGRKQANCFDIATDTQIKDYNGTIWNCYLWRAEYLPKMDCYELEYKAYKGA